MAANFEFRPNDIVTLRSGHRRRVVSVADGMVSWEHMVTYGKPPPPAAKWRRGTWPAERLRAEGVEVLRG